MTIRNNWKIGSDKGGATICEKFNEQILFAMKIIQCNFRTKERNEVGGVSGETRTEMMELKSVNTGIHFYTEHVTMECRRDMIWSVGGGGGGRGRKGRD